MAISPMHSLTDSQCDSIAVLDERRDHQRQPGMVGALPRATAAAPALAAGVGIDYLAVVRRAAATDSLAAAALRGCEEVLAGRQTLFTLEYPCHSPDRERWFECRHPLLGAIKGWSSVIGTSARTSWPRPPERIAERRQNERDLNAVLNSVSSMIGYWDRNLRNRFANHAYRDWFGIDPATIPGKHIREVIGEERYRLNLPYIEAVLRGSSTAVRTRHSVAGWPLGAPCAGPLHPGRGQWRGAGLLRRDHRRHPRSRQASRPCSAPRRLAGSAVTRSNCPRNQWLGSPMLERILGIGPEYEHHRRLAGAIAACGRSAGVARLRPTGHVASGRLRPPVPYRSPRDGAMRWMHGLGQVECAANGQPYAWSAPYRTSPSASWPRRRRRSCSTRTRAWCDELIAVQERERADLARELHDELSQHLTAIRAFAGALQRNESAHHEWIKATAQAIDDSARAIYEVSHRLMEGLHPSILDAAGIVRGDASLLEAGGNSIRRSSGGPLWIGTGLRRQRRSVAIYRIVQECLNNVRNMPRRAAAVRPRQTAARRSNCCAWSSATMASAWTWTLRMPASVCSACANASSVSAARCRSAVGTTVARACG
jgi:PAS domain-containing protein